MAFGLPELLDQQVLLAPLDPKAFKATPALQAQLPPYPVLPDPQAQLPPYPVLPDLLDPQEAPDLQDLQDLQV
jgi:hypothetical protein